eukprot:c19387_g1_i1 orf=567-1340(-)
MAMATLETVAMARSCTGTAAAEHCCILQASRASLACSRRPSSSSPSPKGASSSILQSSFLCSITSLHRKINRGGSKAKGKFSVSSSMLGEDPDWSDDDYIVLGLAHCFQQEEGGKLKDVFLVEPVQASTLECLENGGATSYLHVTASTLGTALKYDVSLLPPEFANGRFCEDFDFRAKCTSRTWKRSHAVNNLMNIAPKGSVRSAYNFSLADKRVINKERVVTDADNIKQDLSIDVYGRAEETKEEEKSEIASLYNA